MSRRGSRILHEESGTYAITATGTVIDWPVVAGTAAAHIEVFVSGSHVHFRTGTVALLASEVVTFTQSATAADRVVFDGALEPDLSRADKTHTDLGMRCKTGDTATVIINPLTATGIVEGGA